ncbi:MAG: L-threonylcarbamoyladenylate synthase [Gammaproteobacteria bacterium]|nr:L-threonylcarbamoyladenylate synthase [Gammaproteobacteria bacterium]
MGIRAWALRRARHVVRQGGIIAYPTEAVYGLGCDPFDPDAVLRLLELKQRPVAKGLILIADRFQRLSPLLAPISNERQNVISASWPGPVTWVIPASSTAPSWLRGAHSSLAVRVTAHPVAAALCQALEMPLVSTSANLSRHPPARSALEVRIRCDNKVDYILHGDTGPQQQPTQIRDALSGRVLRT